MVRRTRTSTCRRRTGCTTCKQRHVRCDETKPVCRNCSSAQRICERIALPAVPPNRPALVFVTIRPHASSSLPMIQHQPASSLSLCEEESRYLQLFRNITADRRSGFFNSVFWTRTILQASHFNPAIKHSLIAIGALYKSIEISSTLRLSTRSTSATTAAIHHDFALRQYSKAIRLIRKSFDDKEKISLRDALISCILFSCFESFHGDQNAAIAQIYSGMKLLKDRKQNAMLLKSWCNVEGVENDLIQLFRDTFNTVETYNLAFYHKTILPVYISSTTDRADGAPLPDIPAVFSTLEQAHGTWELLKKSAMQFVTGVLRTVDGRYRASMSGMIDGRAAIILLMDRCSVAMQDLLRRTRETPDFLAANAAYLDLKMSLILFKFTFETDETYFDAYNTEFVHLLDLVETVLAYQNETSNPNLNLEAHHKHDQGQNKSQEREHELRSYGSSTVTRQKAHFAFDTTIIYPLFYVGTRCRISSVRRRAIDLLQIANRREGPWDSGLAAKVAQLIMEIEERPSESAGAIPETKRVTLQNVEFEDGGRVAIVSFVSKCGVSKTVRIVV